MSEFLPNNMPSENEPVSEVPAPQPSFFQKNKLVIFIGSGVLLVALALGVFFLTRPSPAQPYLDKVCSAFAGFKIGETSYNDDKAILEAQTINMDQAKILDLDASKEVADALDAFSEYVDKQQSTNIRLAIAIAYKDIARLGELYNQIDLDSAVGKSAISQMDAACGR